MCVFFIRGRVLNAIESIDRTTSWLYSVARNKIIDRYRRDAVRPKRTDFELLSGKDDDTPLTLQEILPIWIAVLIQLCYVRQFGMNH